MMSSCCATNTSKKVRQHCPECGKSCLRVSAQTLIHHVQFPDNQHLEKDDYSFCSNRQCATAYFSSTHVIAKQHVRAFKKDLPAMLCYCFDISESSYQAALESKTAEPIKAFVIEQTKAATCACEIRNPSGRCCLAHFKDMENNHEHR